MDLLCLSTQVSVSVVVLVPYPVEVVVVNTSHRGHREHQMRTEQRKLYLKNGRQYTVEQCLAGVAATAS